jgi:putative exporter of polyketide antibiotics
MTDLTVVLIVAGTVVLFIVVELVAAVLPLLIVVTLVPPRERQDLAHLLAAADSSRKLRVWSALRLAVSARRHSVARR